MWIIKKCYVIAMAFLIVTLFSIDASAEKKIGIISFNEEQRYIENQKGIMDELEENGFGRSAVKYTIENAKGSKMNAVNLAQKFAAKKMDLIITLGTTVTIPVAKEIQTTPIVFSQVFDPIEARIANDWKSSGNNTTGASTKIPMSKLMNSLKELAPVKSLAVLYTPGEKNTEAVLKELQQIQTNFQIKIIPVIVGKKEDINKTLPDVIRTVDAIYLTGSSIISPATPVIVDMANKAKVVTITHLDELVDKGALLGICTNAYYTGRLAGKKAVMILKGAKPSSIPIETVKKVDLILNMKTAKAGQFQIPLAFMKKVTKTIE